MVALGWVKIIVWAVLVSAVLGAVGGYRYFLIPFELRFATHEAAWFAFSFVGEAVLAGVVLWLLRQGVGQRDE